MIQNLDKPRLFGLERSNHDFTKEKSWGKNIFNNTFPASLCCYMDYQSIPPVYLKLGRELNIEHSYLNVTDIFGANPTAPETFFAFERDFVPYQPYVLGTLPRTDLVVMDWLSGQCFSGLEIKLTAIPDNSTSHLADEFYGCEIVVRPDTIVYLALSIAFSFKDRREKLWNYFSQLPHIQNWSDPHEISPNVKTIRDVVNNLLLDNLHLQKPLVVQPIWKTLGKRLYIHEDAFDVFVWSNFAFTRLFFRDSISSVVNRNGRSIVWLTKMLLDFAHDGKINYKKIIDSISLNVRNDKAFAGNGRVTHSFMKSGELKSPRIKREKLKEIILGNAFNLLSPERRLDAAILSTPGIF